MKLQLLLFCMCRINFRHSRNFRACFGGKTSYLRKLRKKKNASTRENISASEAEAIIQKQNSKTSLLQTNVKGQWRSDKSNPVVFFQLLQQFTKRLTVQRECVGLEMEKYFWVSATDICKAVKNWIRRKYLRMYFRNFSVCCWGCSTKSERRSQCHSLLYTHPFPIRISVIANAHWQKLCLFNKLIQQERFTVSSSVNCLFQ